ncbi:Fe(3+) dicitrate transport protein [Xanthomonas sacchari]|uniref:TonB-dependent receptor family protein n=1 Tax=unclassified Xanthomonas TaxID=2643310 RepID=UPI00136E6B5C|nr:MULTISPECIES: TonB-dependent siderophore receptor [unclassified Xanthomonas]MBB6367870.1 Fe(3+) dicitrate transport protein [Xanthomonas sp. F10]MXV34758.1 TonB-dependent siderophore receptor [Xanthomonas sp. LMG 8989]
MIASLSPSLLAVAVVAAMLAPTSVRAEDVPPDADAQARIRQLDAVQVQGSLLGRSTVEDVQHYAGSRQVIDSTQLRTGANRSLDDALQKVPGIKVFDETGTGALPQIMLRGLYESRSGRVQVLEDGIPLALAPYGQTSLSLFPVGMHQIDRIDIVRGGAAVQYGPNNVGGVINLISPDIPTTWTTTLGQKVTAGGAGHYLSDTAISTGGYTSETFGLQLDANWTKGDYWREHSATDIKNLRLRAEWWLAPDKLLKASVQRYVADMDMAGALSTADYLRDPRQSTRPLDAFTGRTTRASLVYQQDFGDVGPFQDLRLDWSNFSARSSRNFIVGMRQASSETWRADLPPQLRQSAPRDFRVYGSEPRLSWTMGDGAVRQQWTLGARAINEDIDFLVGNTRLSDGLYTLVRDWRFKDRGAAAYVSDAIAFADGRVTVTPGLRYEQVDSRYYNLASGARTRNKTDDVLPGLTLGVQASPQWYLYADGQRSLRAPQVTQIIFGDNLDAELAWNYEAGARYQPNARTRVQFGGYLIDFDQQIQLDNTTRTYRNLGKTRHQGGEVEVQWSPAHLRALTLNAGYAYLDARQKSGVYDGLRVPYTSRNQITLGASYRPESGHTTVAVSSYYFSRAFSDAANTVQENAIASVGELPSYWVWNAQLSQVLSEGTSGKLSASLAVNNLFDRKYWYRGIDTSPWGRQPAPGRSVTVGLEYTF